MGVWQVIVISIGLSLDVFAYGLYKGAMVSEIKTSNLMKMVGMVTGFQMGMLFLGNLIAKIPAIASACGSVRNFWTLLSAVVFLGLGVSMILKSFREKYKTIDEKREDGLNYRRLVFWCLITSIDALVAGFGFSFLSLVFWGAELAVGVFTAVSVIVGVIVGYLLGCGPMNKFVTMGGCMVLISAVDFLIRGLQMV